jgi:protein gp37
VALAIDPFDEDVPETLRREVLDLIERTSHLTWLVTTRFPECVLEDRPDWKDEKWPAHVWMGVQVSNDAEADVRVPKLLEVPARVRFVSCEPLLGSVDLRWVYDPSGYACCGGDESCYGNGSCPLSTWPRDEDCDYAKIDLVIAGGELGANARPTHPDWAREIRDHCNEYGVAFYFRGLGEWQAFYDSYVEDGKDLPSNLGRGGVDERFLNQEGTQSTTNATHVIAVRRVGQVFTGVDLDGVEYREIPVPRPYRPFEPERDAHHEASRQRVRP